MKLLTPYGTTVDPDQQAIAYRIAFGSIAGQAVLHDLAPYCFAHETTLADSDRQTYVNIGRQQVWQHINNMLGLTSEQIHALYRRQGVQIMAEEDNG